MLRVNAVSRVLGLSAHFVYSYGFTFPEATDDSGTVGVIRPRGDLPPFLPLCPDSQPP